MFDGLKFIKANPVRTANFFFLNLLLTNDTSLERNTRNTAFDVYSNHLFCFSLTRSVYCISSCSLVCLGTVFWIQGRQETKGNCIDEERMVIMPLYCARTKPSLDKWIDN